MNLSRRTLIVWLVGCLIGGQALPAQEPVAFSKQFTAEMLITAQNGTELKEKIYTDNGRVRLEMDASGVPMTMIVRPDQQKIYTIMEAQKMIMVMPYDARKLEEQMAFATGLDRKYQNLGPEVIDGVACTKYQFTSEQGKVYDLWADTARKIPIKMSAEDHSFSMVFKDYQIGPQDAALFAVPAAGYQIMSMPSISLPNMPGGPAAQP